MAHYTDNFFKAKSEKKTTEVNTKIYERAVFIT